MSKKKDNSFSLSTFFRKDQNAPRSLLAFEWVIIIYAALTAIYVAVMYSKLPNPNSMLVMRVQNVAILLAMWVVYRLYPCRAMMALRIGLQLLFLGLWYSDTYEINRIMPNLDHVFAAAEQSIFGCQPALLFSQNFSSPWFGELMCVGYGSYFPMLAVVSVFYLICRNEEFQKMAFVLFATFFIHYVIFDLLPVTGPQYYYQAVGDSEIARGIFPNLNDYFLTHMDRSPIPGNMGGPFYEIVHAAHEAGERPTAAFPSSHMSVTFVLVLLSWRTRNRWLIGCVTTLFVLMFFATFYIKAHYVIDAMAGIISGAICYMVFMRCPDKWVGLVPHKKKKGRKR